MDGRDIGTNVFPNAELKFFLSADIDVRVERRKLEMEAKGLKADILEIKENLEKRDHLDQTRKENPLIKAEDALIMDTTNMIIEGQVNEVVLKAKEIIGENA